MDVSTATAEDGEAIRDVAGRSMRASYSISPEQIDIILKDEFDEDRLAERSESDDDIVLLAEVDDEPVGVVTGRRTDDGAGELDWLHVAPEARGEGVGTELFEAARQALADRGAEPIRAAVLGKNQEGEQFFERFDLERVDNRETEIDGETYATHIYGPASEATDDDLHTPETVETDDGTVYTGDEELPGDEAPFLVLYSDESRTDRYGFYCTNCGSLANAADDLGRIECDTCGNESRPDEWDSAYL